MMEGNGCAAALLRSCAVRIYCNHTLNTTRTCRLWECVGRFPCKTWIYILLAVSTTNLRNQAAPAPRPRRRCIHHNRVLLGVRERDFHSPR